MNKWKINKWKKKDISSYCRMQVRRVDVIRKASVGANTKGSGILTWSQASPTRPLLIPRGEMATFQWKTWQTHPEPKWTPSGGSNQHHVPPGIRNQEGHSFTPAECVLQPRHKEATDRPRFGDAAPCNRPTLLKKGMVKKPRERLGTDSRLKMTKEAALTWHAVLGQTPDWEEWTPAGQARGVAAWGWQVVLHLHRPRPTSGRHTPIYLGWRGNLLKLQWNRENM